MEGRAPSHATGASGPRPWLLALAGSTILLITGVLAVDRCSFAAAPEASPAPAIHGQRPAFPGAEGHGQWARGGRNGRIIPITTLADRGPGSLRACLEASGPRVCTFRVGGVIRYQAERPIISNPYLTVAGETAPGDGILITHAGGRDGFTPVLIKNTHDIIIRNIRVRMDRDGEQRQANSGFIIEGSRDVVLDHVSAAWAQDENVGGYGGNDRITISWSIFAEGVPRHDKCALLASDPVGPQHLSFVRNLCAHNGDRNPDVNVPPGSCVEVVNNVLYNAKVEFTEVWESYGGTPVNIVGNYYRPGPSTVAGASSVIRQGVGSKGQARIFLDDNIVDDPRASISPLVGPALATALVCPLKTTPVPAREAYEQVLNGAGAFPRDAVDDRIVGEVRIRGGQLGARDRTLPVMRAGAAYPDQDGDGMADLWEQANGSDPTMSDPWQDADGDRWANLEEFLHYAHGERMAGRQLR